VRVSGEDLDVVKIETVKLHDKAKAFPSPVRGLVAILDALGAATYTGAEIIRFLESREIVLDKLNERAEAGKIDKARLRVFTFNDTVVIVFLANDHVTLGDVTEFCYRLRAFMMDSLQNRILFRGAIALGEFYAVEDATNTVMGPAVSDAAAWYSEADWMGIQATPHASLAIESLFGKASPKSFDHILVDHDVPRRGGSKMRVKVVNWPKAFWVKGLRPSGAESSRTMLLSFLSQHQVPKGTELKYFNTVKFFDDIVEMQQLLKKPK
jgi:hypothetical protein